MQRAVLTCGVLACIGDGGRLQLLLHAAAIPVALAPTPASSRTLCPHRACILGDAFTFDTAKISTSDLASVWGCMPSTNTVVVAGVAAAHQCVLVHHRRCVAASVASHLNCTLAWCVFNARTVPIGTFCVWRIIARRTQPVVLLFTHGLKLPRHAGGPGLATFYRSVQSVERLCAGPSPPRPELAQMVAVGEEIRWNHMVIGVVLSAALALQFRALALLSRRRPPLARTQQE